MLRCTIIFLAAAIVLHAARASLTSTSKVVWEDCGGDGASLRFQSFEMSVPRTPGMLDFYMDAVSDETLEHLTLETKFSWEVWWFGGGRMDFPCVNNIGSCLYEDVCGLLSQLKKNNGNVCPQEMQNIGLADNCTCPFQPGRAQGYFSVYVPELPKEIEQLKTGKWLIEMSLQNQSYQEVACLSGAIDWDILQDES